MLKKQKSTEYPNLTNSWEIYQKYWLPFGQVLTDMERVGFKIDLDHMNKISQQARQSMEEKRNKFLDFIISFQKGKNIDLFNPSSTLQLQQLIFAPYKIQEQKQNIEKMKKDK